MNMTEKKQQQDHDYSFEKVPQAARKGFWPMLFIMLGFTFFSASMSAGAKLGNGLDLDNYIAGTLAGGVILAVYTSVLAYIGSDSGLSFDLLAQHAFGRKGSYLPSVMIALTQVGWFGVGAAMFAIPASELMGIPPLILIIIAGACMTASAYFGIKGLEIVSYVSVPLISILGIYSMYTAVVQGGGLRNVFGISSGSLTIFTAISIVVGSFVSGGTCIPNFARFAKSNKIAVITVAIAFFIGNNLMFAFGAVGGAFTGKDDIFYVMIAQGLAIPAIIVLGANVWTTNDNALYSGAMSMSNITKIRKRPLVVVAGIIGTVLSVWLYNNFVTWLGMLNSVLPPIGAIIILDYFRNRKAYSVNPEPGIKAGAVAGVILGAIVGIFVDYGISSVNAMVVACICDVALEWVIRMAGKKGK